MAENTDRISTALGDRYRVESHLGEGGMANVYLAEDLKHRRKVAVKVLRPELAAVLGAERFVQEITTTAKLQHPHILPLFDSGEVDGLLYYVMPFIDGETLRNKLDRETQLGIEEAVRIATDVADALDYAHRHNVIHRDIKPENILLHDGRPMVADFGIALAVSAAAGARMTETGLSVGTPHYMSPEQATAEKEITSRSDIYSLGSMLYEMLAGRPPHLGASAQQVVMQIVTEEAKPVTDFRKAVPPHVAAATARSLEKLPADRFAQASEFAAALANPAFGPAKVGASTKSAPAADWRGQAWLPTAVLAATLGGVSAWGWFGTSRNAPTPIARFEIQFPAGQELIPGGSGSSLVLSRDGSQLVYPGPSRSSAWQLWLRPLEEFDGRPIPGTENAHAPTFSPDGREIAFVIRENRTLRIVSLDGGVSRTVADSVRTGGIAWAEDNALYFRTMYSTIARVNPSGGQRETVTETDRAGSGLGHVWPEPLSDGTGMVFALHRSVNLEESVIAAVRFGSNEVIELTRGTFARVTPSRHLVWAKTDGTVMAATFDERSFELGSAAPVLDNVRIAALLGSADLTISRDGRLLYQTGPAGQFELTWVSRDGAMEPLSVPGVTLGFGSSLALSPSGDRLAITGVGEGATGNDVWIMQLPNGPLSRLTTDANNVTPQWSPDGRSVVYGSDRNGTIHTGLYALPPGGAASPQMVLPTPGDGSHTAPIYSSDGQWLVFHEAVDPTAMTIPIGGIFAIRPGVDSVPLPVAATDDFLERAPTLSPDGRWLAYVSNETGRDEVYVRPFPNAQDGVELVSRGGGTEPLWGHGGDELFYRNGRSEMVAARVGTDPVFTVVQHDVLFPAESFGSNPGHRMYDVSPDGQRFIMVHGQVRGQSLVFVENFFEELKATVGN